MTSIENNGRFRQAISCLSPQLCKKLLPLEKNLLSTAQEIRLRVNRPLSIVCPQVTYYLTSNGGLVSTPIKNTMLMVSRADIADTFHNICNYSVYTRQNEIINGFITVQGGHRAGICGTAVVSDGKITNIRDISSINLRIAREYKGCAEKLYQKIGSFDKGVLICGAPCSGKTTVLRDLARILSNDNKIVSLIDERGELAGTTTGMFQNDIGMCDVYDGYKKSEAILQSIRSMAPDIIICDEIGSQDDIKAVEQSVNCGVAIIATLHASSEHEIKQRDNIQKLLKTGAFSKIIFLANKNSPGEIVKITSVGDLIVV